MRAPVVAPPPKVYNPRRYKIAEVRIINLPSYNLDEDIILPLEETDEGYRIAAKPEEYSIEEVSYLIGSENDHHIYLLKDKQQAFEDQNIIDPHNFVLDAVEAVDKVITRFLTWACSFITIHKYIEGKNKEESENSAKQVA
jgi:hypothetical protein